MGYVETGFYALLWLGFGVLHSVLAGTSVKRILRPLFGRGYRLGYNLFSALHIGLILIVGREWLATHPVSLNLPGEINIFILSCRWIGVGIILAGLTQYDLGRFAGLTQLRAGGNLSDEEEPLHITGLHRYVRHPLYLGAYLFLWGGTVDDFGLQTALWGSLYLYIGTWFEERKLISLYGQSYIEYRAKVPAILPIRGRAI